MKPRNSKSKGKVMYYPPEIMPFAYCAACLDIVLDENEKAALLFDEIIECYKLPGWTQLLNKIENETPDVKTVIKTIVKYAG